MKSDDLIIEKKGFEITWDSQDAKSTKHPGGFCSAREWQIEAFNELKESSHMILNAPMGSGKSWMMCLLSAYKMKKKSSLRCIITVPQTIIASGFMNAKLLLPDGEKLEWSPSHNLCNEEIIVSTVKYLIRWLETPQYEFNNRILICTHATLVAAYKSLTKNKKTSYLKDILLWIDEAHHVKNSILRESNNMGELVEDLIKKEDLGVQIGLTTATFFRGDRDRLISQGVEQLFTRYNLPYDRYLKSMKYLKSFSFDFVICGQDYMKAMDVVIAHHTAKDIVYIPKPRSRHSKGPKKEEVSEILHIYKTVHNGELKDTLDGLTILKSSNRKFKILDLVDEDRRKEKKSFLSNKNLQTQKDRLDVIIALDMFKEGANWIWADRCIIVGPRGSLVDVIQMVGRLFRDAKDKEHVEVVQLLPFSVTQDSEDLRGNLNNYLKAIYSLLILEDILKPIKILVPKKEEGKKTQESKNNLKTNNLHDLIPDENKRKEVVDKAAKHLINLYSACEDQKATPTEIYKEFQKSLPSALGEAQLTTPLEVELIGDHVWSLFLRDTLKLKGIDVENIDFEIISEVHPLEGLLRFTTNYCNIDSFTKLRAAIDKSRTPLTVELIFDFVSQYKNTFKEYPKRSSGMIDFCPVEFEGLTWAHIDGALYEGLRGLPGGSSLAKFLKEHFGVRNKGELPSYTKELVIQWIQQHYDHNNEYPNHLSGTIVNAKEEYEGDTWSSVNVSLVNGKRGFPGGSSLALLIEEEFGKINVHNKPPFKIKKILEWAEKYKHKYKKFPTGNSGEIEFAVGEYKGTTWSSVDNALKSGGRGFPGGSSLAKLFDKEYGVRNIHDLPDFSEDLIYELIELYFNKNKTYPNRDSGSIEFISEKYKDESWSKVNTAFTSESRGLSGFGSLADFISKKFNKRNHMKLPKYTESLIINWIQQYKDDNQGKYPSKKSGIIKCAKEKYKGSTWGGVNIAFVRGLRGLKAGSSLSKFIKSKFKRKSQYSQSLV